MAFGDGIIKAIVYQGFLVLIDSLILYFQKNVLKVMQWKLKIVLNNNYWENSPKYNRETDPIL
jgi:hypothetical protein